jgi:translation initiation factor IF-2
MTSKELMAFLKTQGHDLKSHMATIEDSVARILRDRLKPKLPPKPVRGPTPPGTPAAAAKTFAPGAVKRPEVRSADPRSRAGRDVPGPVGANGGRGRGAVPARPLEKEWKDKAKTVPESKGAELEKSKVPPRKVRYFPSDDFAYQAGSRFGGGVRRRPRPRGDARGGREPVAVVSSERPEKIEVSPPVTVKDLSAALGVKAQVLIKTLLQMGNYVTINQYLDEKLVQELGLELGTEVVLKHRDENLEESVRAIDEFKSSEEDLVPRAPVVTFLGHVDHGKTSLLDKIRQTSVTQKEAGGITQHLGAYRVDKGDIHVTFIDTPGHKAFTEMRARGANVTDVAVLVVAADDGPMPQTEEAINHARAAEVPIVVALNKVDKANANVQRCMDALSKLGLIPVQWGGKTEFVEVSALTGQGIDNLLETLSLESEILALRSNPKRPGMGTVLEAEASPSRGVLATVLVQDGRLRVGDYVLCGATHGRVRNLLLNGVTPVEEAGASMPVKVIGLSDVPGAGDKLYVWDNPQQARQIAEERLDKRREAERIERQKATVTLENIFKHLEKGETKEVRLILKADVRGSIEAIRKSLEGLSTEEVKIRILHAGVGAINQEDISLAAASDAIVLGFTVIADERARALAEESRVEIRLYRVIYELLDDIKAAMEARLTPEKTEVVHGHAEIRKVYKASKIGNIAGCMVTDGFVARSDQVRLVREGRVIYTGQLSSLKRFKDDVKEVKEGFECGMRIANYEDIKEGDVVESFAIVEKPRNL